MDEDKEPFACRKKQVLSLHVSSCFFVFPNASSCFFNVPCPSQATAVQPHFLAFQSDMSSVDQLTGNLCNFSETTRSLS